MEELQQDVFWANSNSVTNPLVPLSIPGAQDARTLGFDPRSIHGFIRIDSSFELRFLDAQTDGCFAAGHCRPGGLH